MAGQIHTQIIDIVYSYDKVIINNFAIPKPLTCSVIFWDEFWERLNLDQSALDDAYESGYEAGIERAREVWGVE